MSSVLINASLAISLTNFRGPLIRELRARGHQVHATAPDVGDDVRTALEAIGVEVHPVPLARTGLSVSSDLAYYRALCGVIDRCRPDVALNYTIKPNIWGSLAARRKGVPAVSMVTGLGYAFADRGSLKTRMVGRVARALYRFALARNRAVLFQNPDDVADFIAAGCLADDRKVRMTAGSGVDLEHYRLAALPDRPAFLMVARLLKAKGIREYVEAARIVSAQVPDACFTLVGMEDDGPDALPLADVARLSGGAINYRGTMTDVRPAIADASVYVLPSYREGTPRSSLEAMAMGRPVITTDAPGCRETVRHGVNGLLVPVGDADALAAAMVKLARDPVARQAMGRKSFEMATETFAVDKVNEQIIRALALADA